MKTDREVAEEILADEFKANLKDPSDLQLQVTLNPDVGIIIQAMVKLCKHKEESRWIPVSENPPKDYDRVLFIDERDSIISIGYFVLSQTKCDWLKFWMPLPTPPQTNK